jgi:hypothetical protein
MSEIKIKAVDPKSKKTATVNFKLPDTTAQAVQMWGEDVVLGKVRRTVVIDVQAKIRNWLTQEKPLTEAEIQTAVNNWKPGVTAVKMSFAEKIAAKYAKNEITDQDIEALSAKLKAMRAAKAGGGK